jgi:addiction module RelE/StbE family toxin
MLVRWTRRALADLDEIQDFIAEDSPRAAYEVARDIAAGADGLADHPHLGRAGRVRGTRELVIAHLPYIVVYRVTDQVEVLAVVHMARDWPEQF